MLKILGANLRGMRQIAQEQRAERGELRAVEYFSEPMLPSLLASQTAPSATKIPSLMIYKSHRTI